MTATTEIDRVRALVAPIASDLDLDLYDIERRGATIRVTLDTRAGAAAGITLDELSLATRLISRELDHEDPIPGRYTLEVTSPGLERPLRTPSHFQREVGKQVVLRLRDVENGERRIDGTLTSADDAAATVRLASGEERTVGYDAIDRARTAVDWSPKPKPGRSGKGGKGGKGGIDSAGVRTVDTEQEKHRS
jgi:ribosome maturation factor RimP